MRIYKASSYDEMSRKAAHVISALVTLKPDCVLGLATGSSPIGTYKQLIKWYQDGDLDFSQVKTANYERVQRPDQGKRSELLLFYGSQLL